MKREHHDINDPANHDWNSMYSEEHSGHSPADPLVLELIRGLRPGRALDVGCGAGGILVALAQRGWRVSGVDIASKGIAVAAKVLAAHRLQAELTVADAAAWRPPHTYDLVTNTFALPGTQPAQRKVFAMMRAAVAPGGTVLLKDFDQGMKEVQSAFAAWHMPTVAELRQAFEGFDVQRAETVSTPPHDHDGKGTHAGERWTAVLFMARRPTG